jgi:hypothetical protein
MLTFISGWACPDRDKVILSHRDPTRRAIYFAEGYSSLPDQLPGIPTTELWRNGRGEFEVLDAPTQIVRVMYDTDNTLIEPAIRHILRTNADSQVIVAYDATRQLANLYPHLRSVNALLAADAHLNAPDGDHVIFTRGGSFAWRDHMLESQTATLVGSEELDVGVVNDALTELDY